jgi:glycosyltransferase involved in cell wall biosynthesis
MPSRKESTPPGGQKVRVLISYATSPDKGSEPGVGWAFLKTYAELCQSRHERLIAVIRGRDLELCHQGLLANGLETIVTLLAPEVSPRLSWLGNRGGARVGYLLWRPLAMRAICQATKRSAVASVHQVTWASFLLPSACPRRFRKKFIWGPAAVSRRLNRKEPIRSRIGQSVINSIARHNSAKMPVVISTNTFTSTALTGQIQGRIFFEPNIFLEQLASLRHQENRHLIMAGRLIPRKRPWLAVEALLDSRLSDVHLNVIGDGPLRESLEEFCRNNQLAGRVAFHGLIDRLEVLERLRGTRLLVHPAEREGAGWVIGEAASLGVPAVVFEDTGAATVVELSGIGGKICPETDNPAKSLADGIVDALSQERPEPTDRWSIDRLPGLLEGWWQEVES